MVTKEHRSGREQRPLRPVATLQALENDPISNEVDVLTLEKRHLPYTQPIEVDQGEEGLIARIIDGREETTELELAEVARKALVWRGGQRSGG